MHWNSKIFLLPGLWNSGAEHWQSHWERTWGFERVKQDNWDTPAREDWIARLDETIQRSNAAPIIVAAHSLGCATVAFWAQKYKRVIRGALLVAPSDSEAPGYPTCITGFSPMPTQQLPFPSIVVTSLDDEYVTPVRAAHFATSWGSRLVTVERGGHLNTASQLGLWDFGAALLRELDSVR
jgi:uncharacterized protein